jgi:hypothetical protein
MRAAAAMRALMIAAAAAAAAQVEAIATAKQMETKKTYTLCKLGCKL